MSEAQWLELDGAVNVRDVGGLPTVDGGTTRTGRLIRSDNLQGLSERDVRELVERHNVRSVADLRTEIEVSSEGPGPLTEVDDVEIAHLSLLPEQEQTAIDPGEPVVLPWQHTETRKQDRRKGAAAVYERYLGQRADSVVAALRLIAQSRGATIVHCAAGKDRTGVVIAFALLEVGVTREAVVADYARSAERIESIIARLKASHTYRGDLEDADPDRQAPKARTMEQLLDALDERWGGVGGWLRAHDWTDADAAALRAKLLDT